MASCYHFLRDIWRYKNMKTKDELPACPVATSVALVGGKWKLLIIRNLRIRPWRFNELQRDLEGISQKVLTDSLRQMMDDGLVYRHDYHELPPRVDYSLTELGEKMLPIIDALADFGNYYKSVVE
jgi:DNA-binding HxlR family transcriptional regulator